MLYEYEDERYIETYIIYGMGFVILVITLLFIIFRLYRIDICLDEIRERYINEQVGCNMSYVQEERQRVYTPIFKHGGDSFVFKDDDYYLSTKELARKAGHIVQNKFFKAGLMFTGDLLDYYKEPNRIVVNGSIEVTRKDLTTGLTTPEHYNIMYVSGKTFEEYVNNSIINN